MRLSLTIYLTMLASACTSNDEVASDPPDAAPATTSSAIAAGTPRVITDEEWAAITPTVREFLAAVRRGDLNAAIALAADSAAATKAVEQQHASPVLIAALEQGMTPANGGWHGDTLVAQFTVPGRSMQPHCYQDGQTDDLQIHLRRLSGAWRVHRLAGRYC
jgi:hypothetical protein